MRILILGGDGMLGHQLLKYLHPRHEVKVTLRQDLDAYASFGLFNRENAYDDVDVRSLERLVEVIERQHDKVFAQRPRIRESSPYHGPPPPSL